MVQLRKLGLRWAVADVWNITSRCLTFHSCVFAWDIVLKWRQSFTPPHTYILIQYYFYEKTRSKQKMLLTESTPVRPHKMVDRRVYRRIALNCPNLYVARLLVWVKVFLQLKKCKHFLAICIKQDSPLAIFTYLFQQKFSQFIMYTSSF